MQFQIDRKEDRSITLNPLHEHRYSLIWLHGLGDSAYGFVDVFLDENYKFVPNYCKVVLLTAPQRAVTLNNGMVMTSWYDIKDLSSKMKSLDELYQRYSKEELMESVGIVSKVIDQEVKNLKGDTSKVLIGGFSQGCALALATFLHYPKALGGIVGLSGMNAMKIDWSKVPDLENKKKTPIFLYHGEDDDMIRFKIALETYKELQDKGLNIQIYSEQGLGHHLSQKEVLSIRDFLSDVMKQ